ncbi:MAG: sulfatase-like hydrolase/transferase [Phycisphaerales bacterium]|nr:sulfatase-like hydrolase/transferase [Phycisphaerales bacterium]
MRILYIDIDTLRPDHLGCYGYHRNTSPNIDAIAKDALRFDQYYTPNAPCLPSRTSLYSGRLGIQTGVVGHGGTAADPKLEGKLRNFRGSFTEESLPRNLQKLGLYTAMISPFGQRHSAYWFLAGFNEVHDTGKGGMESAEEIQPVIDRWFDANAKRDNWYLHINVWDPHTPYRVPAEFGEPFKDEPLPKWLDDDELIQRHMKKAGPHSALDVTMYDDQENPRFPRQPGKVTDKASMRKLIDGYDTGILYADAVVGKIVAHLKAAGVYDDTIIILSSDHGENFGELGIYAEHATADVGTCRIPFIVKWPGGPKGKANTNLHCNVDLAPTLMDLLDGPKPELWDGQSFAGEIIPGKPSETPREELILGQCCHVCQRSVRFGNWLYMRTYHDGFHLFPQEMLFDLANDPHEQNNLAASRPEICHEAAWRLARWHDEQMQKMAIHCSDVTDPLWTVIREGGPLHAKHDPGRSQLPKYLERLEKTDRSDSAKALREKYARYLK